jgi:hypothetical protein
VEPMSSRSMGRPLAELFIQGRHIPLNSLEGSFSNFSVQEAQVAYAESLALVEYMRDTYGMSDITRIMQRVGEGQSIEAALRATIRSGYAELEQELAQHFKRMYGN